MRRTQLRRNMTVLLIVLGVLLWASVSTGMAQTVFEEVEQAQLKVVSEYFELLVSVEESEPQFALLTEQIEEHTANLAKLQRQLQESEDRYLQARERTVTALRWINRKGPMSYLQVLFGAASLRDFLRRTDLISAVGRGTLAAFSDVKSEMQAREVVKEEIDLISSELAGLEAERDALLSVREELDAQEQLLQEAFGQQWPEMSARLDELADGWLRSCAGFLQQLPERFARLAEQEVHLRGITMVPSFFEVVVTIPSGSLNEVLDADPLLRGAEFRFFPGEAHLVADELDLVIVGDLSITPGGMVSFYPVGLYLDGIPLTSQMRRDAVGEFGLDLSSEIGAFRAESLTVRSEEVQIVLSLRR